MNVKMYSREHSANSRQLVPHFFNVSVNSYVGALFTPKRDMWVCLQGTVDVKLLRILLLNNINNLKRNITSYLFFFRNICSTFRTTKASPKLNQHPKTGWCLKEAPHHENNFKLMYFIWEGNLLSRDQCCWIIWIEIDTLNGHWWITRPFYLYMRCHKQIFLESTDWMDSVVHSGNHCCQEIDVISWLIEIIK